MNLGITSWSIDWERTGVNNYAYNLIKYLIKYGKSRDIFLFHYEKSQDAVYSKTNDVIIPKIPFKMTNLIGLPQAIKRARIDVLHMPIHWYTQITPFFLNLNVKKVLTIHDLTPILFPETHTRETSLLWNLTLKLIKNRIDVIVAISWNTKKDCLKHLGLSEKKIKVIHLGVDDKYKLKADKDKLRQELKRRYNLGSPFILYVGTLEKRKNISTLIKAFYKLKKEGIKHKLVIVGSKGWRYKDIFEAVKKLNLQKEVVFTGYVPEEDLVIFYNLADLFVYPSLYEGFGLPPLEAMACGCPVISSNTSSLPEIMGDAGIMVDPFDVNDLALQMYNVLNSDDLSEDLSSRGLNRAKMFTWERTAKDTWKIYEKLYKM